jgi:hypothetical protein
VADLKKGLAMGSRKPSNAPSARSTASGAQKLKSLPSSKQQKTSTKAKQGGAAGKTISPRTTAKKEKKTATKAKDSSVNKLKVAKVKTYVHESREGEEDEKGSIYYRTGEYDLP